jgi:DNA-directed RNA polymerase specialized sigma24 family protein
MTNSELVEHTYRKHNNWLSQVAYNFTSNKDNAEELVQELYLKLME